MNLTSMTSCITTVPLKVTYDKNAEGEMCALAAGNITNKASRNQFIQLKTIFFLVW